MKTQQFCSRLRLHSACEFQRIFRDLNKKTVHAPNIKVYACANKETNPRLGITVGRRAARHAVWRNKIKRQIRESFRYCQHDLPNMDFVVLCHPGIHKQTKAEICGHMNQCWEKFNR